MNTSIRARKLRNEEKTESLSRSFPTSVKPNCFQKCLNTSTDSIVSDVCRSPKFGQYQKLPTRSECDVCQVLTKDTTNLKCLHTFCSKCLEIHKIFKNGCPVCARFSENNQDEHVLMDEKSGVPNDDLIFSNFDSEQIEEESLEGLVDTLQFEVLPNVEARHKAIQDEIERLSIDVDKEIARIHDYVHNLKTMIDKRAENMVRNANESRARHCSELSRQMKTMETFTNRIKECVERHRNHMNWLQSGDSNAKKHATNSLSNLVKLSELVTEENVHIKCTCKPLTEASVDFMGKVGVRVFLAKPLIASLCKTFQFPGAVHSICPVNSDQAWIGYQHFIQLCSKTGNRYPPIDVNDDVHDIASDKKGNILIACHSDIKLLDTSNELKTLFHCNKTPQGIAVLDDGNIVACVGKEVVVYSPEGETISVFGDANTGDMKMPYKVVVNATGDICVTDYQSSAGEVAVFDSGGRPKAKVRTEGMAPRGVACNVQGIIYVADFRADRVNLYSPQGHFLHTLVNSNSDGLSGPLGIAVDDGGDLWIGDWKRKVRVYGQSVAKVNDYTD